MWGVIIQLGALSKGLSLAGGSTPRTSQARPASLFSFKASAASFSFIRGPRPVLIMIEVFFILFKDSAFIISFVSGVKGQFKLIISEEEKSSSKETCFAFSKPLIFFLERLK